ncbi:hypothetical protein C3489_31550 [Streptomyces sp. Ru71]|uniref:hypothetical protein n=1 Tax=Streptomyces sp. Ru71 TaxID=2080746 RepID=UPI000CDDC1C8|nr:hypothetical protein [Streptomyces sp. Ru71]POX46632.1 hypothetical protein C3489_31550 [Streptomyces sp. Ru71]
MNDSKSEYNAFARAWGPKFLISALVVLVVYMTLVTWLAPEAWRFPLYPVGMIPVYLLARWFAPRS